MAANERDEMSLQDGSFENEDELREAMSVLGGSDPDNCSYPQGYVKRQAVFACNTCTPRGAEPAGICLACANKCHDDHDIFELYTKRNFRCDCGNRKFGEFRCTLFPDKDDKNVKNNYDHNFHGCYCSCDRPYPDTDDQVNEEMIQCVVCEDWFHGRHLGCEVVEAEEMQEMVCETCMNKAPFLWTYAAHFAAPPVVKVSPCGEEVELNGEADGKKELEEEEKRCDPSNNGGEGSSTSPGRQMQDKQPVLNGSAACKRTHQEMTASPVKRQTRATNCRLKELQAQSLERTKEGAVFWPYHWRAKLCTCTSCKRAYVGAGVQFLMDESDTLMAYEVKGRLEPLGEDPLMSCLSTLDRAHQLEIIYCYNDLKTELTEFLKQFADEGRVVTPEAIHQFFEELQSRKRRRPYSEQYNS